MADVILGWGVRGAGARKERQMMAGGAASGTNARALL